MNIFLLDAPVGTEAEGTIQAAFIRRHRYPAPRDQAASIQIRCSIGRFRLAIFMRPHQIRLVGQVMNWDRPRYASWRLYQFSPSAECRADPFPRLRGEPEHVSFGIDAVEKLGPTADKYVK
ncbi:hypothetical protein [Rhizobium sp. PL01]|uniref:hypothetical protein n=1 Tax=Rhizobium sp. PL01 TaxID=3085631 RepID=UPI002981A5DB|nr:hypothetical protein [Rhizobium sp. PL01]MDW5316148.1 hypothetical protein [Rhizobium sp. PL01]